ncbi:group 1 glycosyl transferase, partial [Candidatus Thiomargarita nelsonii]
EEKNGVTIYDVGKSKKRSNRIFKTTKEILEKAIELDSDIYHFHDPELIPIGLKLKKLGKKVIYDIHEDVEEDILSKDWIPLIFRKIVSLLFARYEKFAIEKFDAIITATPYIKEKLLKINKNSQNINNFPILGELSNQTAWKQKKNEVCYVGGISRLRGIKEIVNAISKVNNTNVRLKLAGLFSPQKFEQEISKEDGWDRVDFLGWLD